MKLQCFLVDYRCVARFAAVGYTLREVFGGPLRHATDATGTVVINYVPPGLAIVAMIVFYMKVIMEARISRFMFVVSVVIALYGVYSLISPISISQSLVGFYIWLPVMTGILLGLSWEGTKLESWALTLWIVVGLGILLNSVVSFPWEGGTYEVLGMSHEISRSWQYEGYNRIAGFGRSSFASSCLLLFFACIVLTARHFPLTVRWCCYLSTCYPLFLTTSKTLLVLWAVIAVLYSGYLLCGLVFLRRLMVPYRWAYGCIVSILVLVIGLPLLGQAPEIVATKASYSVFSFESLAMRFYYAWPKSFELLSHGGNMFFGRGIGGIGMPQQLTEPDLYMFGDNLFVYVYVSSGVVGVVLLFCSLLSRLRYLYIYNTVQFEIIFVLIMYILGVSITMNAVEGPVQALLLGALITQRRAYNSMRKVKSFLFRNRNLVGRSPSNRVYPVKAFTQRRKLSGCNPYPGRSGEEAGDKTRLS